MPDIIFRTKAVLNNSSKNYTNYLEYMDRDSAKEKETSDQDYLNYLEYMDRESAKEKSLKYVNLFTRTKNGLTENEKIETKRIYDLAQKNKSIMWQSIISFDNAFLDDTGIRSQGKIDRAKLMDVTRKSMDELLKKEGIDKTSFWSGAIHYNTEHIHVHVAIVQTSHPRTRYKFKLQNIKATKRVIAREIYNVPSLTKDINNILRNDLSKTNAITFDLKMKKELKDLIRSLPEDGKLWRYNNNVLKDQRECIDRYISEYLNKNNRKYSELMDLLDKQEQAYRKIYGNSGNYKENKLKELQTRLGNNFLRELKNLDENGRRISERNPSISYKTSPKRKIELKTHHHLSKYISILKKMNDVEIDKFKNEIAYEKLKKEVERSELESSAQRREEEYEF